ncbi:MAG: copper ion binding protein [Candidatus Pristimantibacillus sp.]
MANVTLNVKGMTCGHCVNSVEKAITGIGASGTVDLAGGKVAVQYDDSKVSLETIKGAIEDQGYDVV